MFFLSANTFNIFENGSPWKTNTQSLLLSLLIVTLNILNFSGGALSPLIPTLIICNEQMHKMNEMLPQYNRHIKVFFFLHFWIQINNKSSCGIELSWCFGLFEFIYKIRVCSSWKVWEGVIHTEVHTSLDGVLLKVLELVELHLLLEFLRIVLS